MFKNNKPHHDIIFKINPNTEDEKIVKFSPLILKFNIDLLDAN